MERNLREPSVDDPISNRMIRKPTIRATQGLPLGVFDYELQQIKGRFKKRALELVEVAEWPCWTFGY